jgi:CubicO group peptidase (beta-lactamase class C family)
MIAGMAAATVLDPPTQRPPSGPAIGRIDPSRLDLSAAFEQTRRVVADGAVPTAVMAVSDAHRVLGSIAVPGPKDRAIRDDSLYFLASVTKPIVATAVMQLVDEGRLDLHEPITRFVPGFSGGAKDRVTAWHVLTHTSGLPDMDPLLYLKKRLTAEQALGRLCAEPLEFEPGSRYSYASDSFYLLAGVIAKLTGLPFAEALQRRVLEPVGAFEVRFDPRALRSRVVRVHGVGVDNRIVQEVVLRFLARATLPGGGLWGTAADLLRFGRSLLPLGTGAGPRILSQAAIDEMTREQTQGIVDVRDDGTTRDPRYALGWGKPHPAGLAPSVIDETSAPDGGEVVRVPASPSTFTHGGASGTRLWIDPERELVFVFLTNQWGVSDGAMFSVLREVYAAWDAARWVAGSPGS